MLEHFLNLRDNCNTEPKKTKKKKQRHTSRNDDLVYKQKQKDNNSIVQCLQRISKT
eukprot:m.62029 g.62029  ORF g.62029 m.62029 type:complete len:56 (+) comp13370_c0_seq6:2514-2681(+)